MQTALEAQAGVKGHLSSELRNGPYANSSNASDGSREVEVSGSPSPARISLGAISVPHVLPITPGTFRISWAQPPVLASGGIQYGFELEYRLELMMLPKNLITAGRPPEDLDEILSRERFEGVYEGPSSAADLRGLKQGRTYVVRVTGLVRGVPSDASIEGPIPSRALFTLPACPSLPPTRPNLVSRSRNQLKFSWGVPENVMPEDILAYELWLAEDPRDGRGAQAAPAAPWAGQQSPPQGMWKFEMSYSGVDTVARATKLSPGARYAAIVRAVTETGPGEFSECCYAGTSASVPSQPGAPTTVSSTDESITLTWPAASDSGSPIERYVVEGDDGEGGDFTVVASCTDTRCTVAKLQGGRSYRFRVRAENGEGPSSWSPVGAARTAATPPGRMGPVSIASCTSSSVSAAWRPVEDDGGTPIKYYEVWIQGKDKAATWKGEEVRDSALAFAGSSTAATVGALRGGCSYQLKVRAANDKGTGPFSAPVGFSTEPCAPDAPRAVCVLHVEPLSCSLAVDPSPHDGGRPVITCRLEKQDIVEEEPASEVGSPPPSAPSTPRHPGPPPAWTTVWSGEPDKATSVSITGLESGRSYIFRAFSLNGLGLSPPSAELVVTTAPSVPTAPSGLRLAQHPSAHSAKVLWRPAKGRGSAVAVYEAEISFRSRGLGSDPGSPEGSHAAPSHIVSTWRTVYQGVETGCDLRELTPNTYYLVRVRAANGVGYGEWSEPLSLQTGPAPPVPPKDFRCVSCGPSSLRLEWSPPPEDYGRPVLSYVVEIHLSGADLADDSGRTSPTGEGRPSLSKGSLSNSAKLSVQPSGGSRGRDGARSSVRAQWVARYEGLERHCVIEGLRPGHQYQVRIRAANCMGQGHTSDSVTLTTSAAPPSCPVNLICQSRGANFARLQWDMPLRDNGAPVLSYKLEMAGPLPADSDSFSAPFQVVHVGSERAFKVHGLEPRCRYFFRALALNSCGASEPSNTVAVDTQLLPPGPPEALAVTGELRDSAVVLRVAWEPPERHDSRAAAQAYEVEVRDGGAPLAVGGPGAPAADARSAAERISSRGGVEGPPRLLTVRDTQAEFMGMEPGLVYLVKARCVGAESVGHSSWSRTITYRAPGEPPAAHPPPAVTARRKASAAASPPSEPEMAAADGERKGPQRREKHKPKAQGPPKPTKGLIAQLFARYCPSYKFMVFGSLVLVLALLAWLIIESAMSGV